MARSGFFYSSYQAGLRLVELDAKTGRLKKNPPDFTTSFGEGAFVLKGPYLKKDDESWVDNN